MQMMASLVQLPANVSTAIVMYYVFGLDFKDTHGIHSEDVQHPVANREDFLIKSANVANCDGLG